MLCTPHTLLHSGGLSCKYLYFNLCFSRKQSSYAILPEYLHGFTQIKLLFSAIIFTIYKHVGDLVRMIGNTRQYVRLMPAVKLPCITQEGRKKLYNQVLEKSVTQFAQFPLKGCD